MDNETHVTNEQPASLQARFKDSSQSELTILYSKILQQFPNVRFGFSTKKGGVSRIPYGLNLSYMVGDDPNFVDQNRERFFGKLGISLDLLAVPKQFHGDFIKIVSTPGVYDLCDALITATPSVYLCVTTADCLPIFLYDPITPAVATVHAGWRGTKLKIVEKTIKKMIKEFNTNPAELRVFIGPGSGVCCYEVGDDVARDFDQRYLVRYSTKKPHLNMKLYTKIQLIDAGVKDKNIEMSEYCTICTPSLFYSFRRERLNSGRMMGVIGMDK
ncbi:MAG: peptidoglycan editing factor PgeF [Bacteroidetes bacterium]|nr:MAG: peptidoglycan editing factor PgeF [Bacteroidota bacterium]